jgi:hypothetical protein
MWCGGGRRTIAPYYRGDSLRLYTEVRLFSVDQLGLAQQIFTLREEYTMTAQQYIPQRTEIVAFVEANRLDFRLQGPTVDTAARCSVYFQRADEQHRLDGNVLRVLRQPRDSDGKRTDPDHLHIQWGRRKFRMRRIDGNGKPRYILYPNDQNEANRPKTAEDLFEAMGI